MAHAQTYHGYKNELGVIAQITMKLALLSAIPRNTSDAANVAAANRRQNPFLSMRFPLFLGQQYPASLLDTPNLNLTALRMRSYNSSRGQWTFSPSILTSRNTSLLPRRASQHVQRIRPIRCGRTALR